MVSFRLTFSPCVPSIDETQATNESLSTSLSRWIYTPSFLSSSHHVLASGPFSLSSSSTTRLLEVSYRQTLRVTNQQTPPVVSTLLSPGLFHTPLLRRRPQTLPRAQSSSPLNRQPRSLPHILQLLLVRSPWYQSPYLLSLKAGNWPRILDKYQTYCRLQKDGADNYSLPTRIH